MKKTSQIKSFLSILSTIILITLFITGCTSENEEIKEKVKTSLMNETNSSMTTFSGEAEVQIQMPSNESNPFYTLLQTFLENGKITWNGSAVGDSVKANTEFVSDQTSLNVPIIVANDKLFFNIPLINPEDEYFEAQKSDLSMNENLNIGELYQQFLVELIDRSDAEKFSKIDSENESQEQTIEMEITQEDLFLVFKDFTLKELEGALPAEMHSNISQKLETYSVDENEENEISQLSKITFILNADGEITNQNIQLNLKELGLSIQHQSNIDNGSDTQINIPDQTISLFDFFTYLDELNNVPEITFEQAISIPDANYADNSVEQEILSLLNKNLQAILDKDKETFSATFSSEKNAEAGWELVKNNLYHFLQVEDLQFKNKSGKSFNVGVLFETVNREAAHQQPLMSGFTFTISKVDSEWKIQRLK
ncbi:hypothetical protein [Chengkuizengella axinellae]|uniref:Lipoprotein n=1 Tax=Chengkuizengella axinellae TaxID=3064388 RepID=A0ABT9IVM9_9BACL|nr:hypothetical protein [Chengkuizengella sp. 2205SS18-9]MDP5273137.1 hypothetical protein [Chengkuizengella sp. 2205SS18-9]